MIRTTVTMTLMGFITSALTFLYIASKAGDGELDYAAQETNPPEPDRMGSSALTSREQSLQA